MTHCLTAHVPSKLGVQSALGPTGSGTPDDEADRLSEASTEGVGHCQLVVKPMQPSTDFTFATTTRRRRHLSTKLVIVPPFALRCFSWSSLALRLCKARTRKQRPSSQSTIRLLLLLRDFACLSALQRAHAPAPEAALALACSHHKLARQRVAPLLKRSGFAALSRPKQNKSWLLV